MLLPESIKVELFLNFRPLTVHDRVGVDERDDCDSLLLRLSLGLHEKVVRYSAAEDECRARDYCGPGETQAVQGVH